MDTSERLRAIEARARALGWEVLNLGDEKDDVFYLGFNDSTFIVKGTKASILEGKYDMIRDAVAYCTTCRNYFISTATGPKGCPRCQEKEEQDG